MNPVQIKNCLAFWDFQQSSLQDKGNNKFILLPNKNPGKFSKEGIFGPGSLKLKRNVYYYIPAKFCGDLNRAMGNSEVTVVAWIKRQRQIFGSCEAIAGIWDETKNRRQYCLFLNIRVTGGKNSVSGHVSKTGKPSLGCKYCEEVAVGKTPVPYNEWCTVAFSYDKKYTRAYLNGVLDVWQDKNPYHYPGALCPTEDDADFTVGAVHRSNKIGNWFHGLLGGLAIYDRALTDEEILSLTCNEMVT